MYTWKTCSSGIEFVILGWNRSGTDLSCDKGSNYPLKFQNLIYYKDGELLENIF